MESNRPTSVEAARLLAEADASRKAFADTLRLPVPVLVALGVAVGVQLAAAAVGIARQDGRGLALVAAGVLVLLVVAVVLLRRFRADTGAGVSGLVDHVILGTSFTASGIYAAALGLATWAAFAAQWWAVAALAVAGGAGYAMAGARWLERYRQASPNRAARLPRAVVLGACAMAGAGLVVLLVGSR